MRARSLISCSIGNILEWYDFGLFAIFSPLFSHLFFPTSDKQTALIATFMLFAVGFFCRPLGALLFGYLGDKEGRASTLRLSVLMISLPTLFIGLLPVYHDIGIYAPILLLLIRMWQGVSLGGEYSGNIIYLGEMATRSSRSFYTSLAASGSNIGILLAMIIGGIVSYLLPEAMLKTWGWRIPYLLSGILSLLIYLTRLNLEETNVFLSMKKNHHITNNPIATVFKENKLDMLRTLGLICMGTTFYYFSFIYLPIYLNTDLSFSLSQSIHIESFFIAAMAVLVPLSGWLSDKVGRYRLLIFNALLISMITIPGFYYLQPKNTFIIILILSVFTLASSLEQGTTAAVLVETFPPPARYTGISLAYNIGNGFLGGSIPVVCAWLITFTHITLAPAVYISCCALITLLISITLYFKRSYLLTKTSFGEIK